MVNYILLPMLLKDGLNIAANCSIYIYKILFYFANRFLPKTNNFLMKNNINIISARSGYENMFPGFFLLK